MLKVKVNSRDFQQMLIMGQQFVDPNSASGRELKKIKKRGQLIEIEDWGLTVKVSYKNGNSIQTEDVPKKLLGMEGIGYGPVTRLDLEVTDNPRVKLYLRSAYQNEEEALETLKRDFVERF